MRVSCPPPLRPLVVSQLALPSRLALPRVQIKASWGSKLDIKCENDPRRGVILRTKRSNDKVLRQQPQVRICAVLKDGVRFTTPKLNKLAKALLDIKTQYEEQQVRGK